MKPTVFIFHGTGGHPQENWFPWLKSQLEKRGYRVFVPQFPSPVDAPSKIDEWFAVMKNYEQFIDKNTILIGHSLGGIFTARILETIQNPVRAAIFVGSPIGVKPILNFDQDLIFSFSGFTFDWLKIKSNAKHFVVFHSDNDPYVGLENGRELARHLGIKLTFIKGAGHFNKAAGYTKFPDLFSKIVNLR